MEVKRTDFVLDPCHAMAADNNDDADRRNRVPVNTNRSRSPFTPTVHSAPPNGPSRNHDAIRSMANPRRSRPPGDHPIIPRTVHDDFGDCHHAPPSEMAVCCGARWRRLRLRRCRCRRRRRRTTVESVRHVLLPRIGLPRAAQARGPHVQISPPLRVRRSRRIVGFVREKLSREPPGGG